MMKRRVSERSGTFTAPYFNIRSRTVSLQELPRQNNCDVLALRPTTLRPTLPPSPPSSNSRITRSAVQSWIHFEPEKYVYTVVSCSQRHLEVRVRRAHYSLLSIPAPSSPLPDNEPELKRSASSSSENV